MILSLLLAAAQVATPAPAAPPTPAVLPASPPQTQPAPKPAIVRVAITTTAGPIVLELEKERAPITTANFLRYVDARRLDGIDFFRSMRLSWGPGLIQAGQHQVAKLYPPIAHEPTTKTGLSHTDGSISMGRMAVGTARADFSIAVGDMTGLDAKPDQPGDNAGYAVFGRVVEGMDVVKRIWMGPRDPNAGTGAMKGEMLKPPVKVLTVRRVP
jgi:peptidyl-prolyl cis-trans isomerase A (cyclophilin A)